MIKKCPKCEASITYVKPEAIDIDFPARYKGAAFLCPRCNSILSVGIDPLALKASTVNAIAKKIRS